MEGPVQNMRPDLHAEGWEGSEKAERKGYVSKAVTMTKDNISRG